MLATASARTAALRAGSRTFAVIPCASHCLSADGSKLTARAIRHRAARLEADTGALGRYPARVVPPVLAAEVSHCLVATLTERRPGGLSQARDDRDRRQGSPRQASSSPVPFSSRQNSRNCARPGPVSRISYQPPIAPCMASHLHPRQNRRGGGAATASGRSRCPPEHIAQHRHPPETCEPDTTAGNRHNTISNQPRPPPQSSRLTVGKPARLQGHGVLPLHRHAADHRDHLIRKRQHCRAWAPLDVAARMLLTVL